MAFCTACGTALTDGAAYCASCGAPQAAAGWPAGQAGTSYQSGFQSQSRSQYQSEDYGHNVIRRIADYERMSGILWIVLGVIQICTVVGIIAGVWNVFAGRCDIDAPCVGTDDV